MTTGNPSTSVWGPWAAAAVAAGACATVALVDPTEQRLSVGCPFQVTTGWWCPFCGATRAASRLVRADVDGALRYNALLVLSAPLLAAIWWAYARPAGHGWRSTVRARASSLLVVGGVVAVLFTVARNLPVDPFTSLRFPGA